MLSSTSLPQIPNLRTTGGFAPTLELDENTQGATLKKTTSWEKEARRKSRQGSMNKHFKFPPTSSPSQPAVPDLPPSNTEEDDSGLTSVGVVAPSSVHVGHYCR